MPDESTTTSTLPEQKSCDALDADDFEALLNEAASELDEPPADASETKNATSETADNVTPTSEKAASPPASTDSTVEFEETVPPAPGDEPSDSPESATVPPTDMPTAETVEAAREAEAGPATLEPQNEQASPNEPAAKGDPAPDPTNDAPVSEAPSAPREPEDRWSLDVPATNVAADAPASASQGRGSGLVRLLEDLLAVCDRPFAHLAPRSKDVIGYAAIATLVMAFAVWAVTLFIP